MIMLATARENPRRKKVERTTAGTINIEVVDGFKYIASAIKKSGVSTEMKRRIAVATKPSLGRRNLLFVAHLYYKACTSAWCIKKNITKNI